MTILIDTHELDIPENKVVVQKGQKVKVQKDENGQMTITVTVEVELIDAPRLRGEMTLKSRSD